MAAEPRFVLLQARRAEDPEREAERRLFAQRLGIDEDRVIGHNLVEGVPDLAFLHSHDAILVGGSGDFYVSDGRFPEQAQLFDVLREVVDGPTPIFGSCFGFQMLTAALGGEVIHDPSQMELGTYTVELTREGLRDELFSALPISFPAQLGRKDRALRLPEGATHLASSERCPFQAFRYGDRPVWATQFHPELDAATNLRRFRVYVESYEGYLEEAERVEIESRFHESPATAVLLPRFLDLIVG